MQKEIQGIILNKLQRTRDCEFKKAWIPEGWAVVNVGIFASELAEEINDALHRQDKR